MDTRRDFIYVDDLVDVVDAGASTAPASAARTTSRPAPTSRSRSCSTPRSTALGHRARRRPVEVRPAEPGRRLHDPARPVRDGAATSAGRRTTPLEDGVAPRDRLLPRVRHRGDLHAPEGGRARDEPVDRFERRDGPRRRRRRLRRQQPRPRRCSTDGAARGPRRRQPALGRARERAGRPARRRSSRASITDDAVLAALDDDLRLRLPPRDLPRQPELDRRPARRPRATTRSRRSSSTSALKDFAAPARSSSTRPPAARVAEKTFDDAQPTTGGRAGLAVTSTARTRSRRSSASSTAIYYHRTHGLPTVKARFQNVYGPGEILGAGRWRGTPATVWRNVTPTFVYKALKHDAAAGRERRRRRAATSSTSSDMVDGLMRCALARRGRATSTTSRAASRRRSASWPRRSTS